MKSRFFRIVNPLMIFLVVSLLAWLPGNAFSSEYNSNELTRRIKTGGYLQKTDNLLVIIDGSGKKDWLGREQRHVKIAKALIERIGNTIPNIPNRRMLRVFGPTADGFQNEYSTIFGLYNIDARDYTPIIATKTLGISDNDPLELTFFSAIADLEKLEGTHAVILISRGDQFSKAAIAESAYLKKAFGGSICYYPIYIGNAPKSEARMQQFQRIGGCGSLSTLADLDSPGEVTDFVESVFFVKKRTFVAPEPLVPIDEEYTADQQQAEEENITVEDDNPYEPELVGDIDDEPVEEQLATNDVIIIERQLPHDKVVTIELHVEFDLNKASVKKEFIGDIQNIAEFMTQYPETEVLLEGHTCSLGSEAYNLALSKKRAQAVQNSLVKDFGLAPERIKIRGAGEAEPIADNSTEEGRVRNRRVMAVISTIVTDFIIIEQEISKEEFLSDDFVLPPIDEALQEQIQPTREEDEVISEETTQLEVTTTKDGVTEEVTTEEVVTETVTDDEISFVTEATTETKITEDGAEPQKAVTVETTTQKIELPVEEEVVVIEDEAAFDTTDEELLTVPTAEHPAANDDLPNWK